MARRLAILSAQNDLTHKEISHCAIELLRNRCVTRGEKIEIQLDDSLVASLIKMIFTDVIWWKMKLIEGQLDEIDAHIETVKSLVKDLFYFCEVAMSSRSTEVQDMAYSCACDALVAYAPQIAHNQVNDVQNNLFKNLIYVDSKFLHVEVSLFSLVK